MRIKILLATYPGEAGFKLLGAFSPRCSKLAEQMLNIVDEIDFNMHHHLEDIELHDFDIQEHSPQMTACTADTNTDTETLSLFMIRVPEGTYIIAAYDPTDARIILGGIAPNADAYVQRIGLAHSEIERGFVNIAQ